MTVSSGQSGALTLRGQECVQNKVGGGLIPFFFYFRIISLLNGRRWSDTVHESLNRR